MSSSSVATIKFLCSYGGKIIPRRFDGRLRYVGGHTRILSVGRTVSYSELMLSLGELCGYSVTLRCQLPREDLDVLVSIKSDEDLENLIEEYHQASMMEGKDLKIRAILSPPKSPLKQISSSSPVSSSSSSAELSTESDHQPLSAHRCISSPNNKLARPALAPIPVPAFRYQSGLPAHATYDVAWSRCSHLQASSFRACNLLVSHSKHQH